MPTFSPRVLLSSESSFNSQAVYFCVEFSQHQTVTQTCLKQGGNSLKYFTSHLLVLMLSAHSPLLLFNPVKSLSPAWDYMSLQAPTPTNTKPDVLESYVLCKIFQGFVDETFNMDVTFHSLQVPGDEIMDPRVTRLFTCFMYGIFCSKKYQEIVHPKMENPFLVI